MSLDARSLHFVPGMSEKMFTKALGLPVDALILDLEDAVTPELKADARAQVCTWLAQADFGPRLRIVRANPLDTPWGADDLAALVAGTPPDALLVPKVSGAGDIERLDALLSTLEADAGLESGGIGLMLVSTETPAGALHLPEMATAPRVQAMTWGAEDLSAALGARRTRDADGRYLPVFAHCRVMTLLAAASGGVTPIDGVYTDIRDTEGLAAECREAADMGFSGKMTLHPAQVDVVNAAFTPSGEDLAEARELLEAFEAAQAEGRMAFSFRGAMVDVPHLERARRLVARADALHARGERAG